MARVFRTGGGRGYRAQRSVVAQARPPRVPAMVFLYGVVTAVDTTNHQVSVSLAPASGAVPASTVDGVDYLQSYTSPQQGDAVLIASVDGDLTAVGAYWPDPA